MLKARLKEVNNRKILKRKARKQKNTPEISQ